MKIAENYLIPKILKDLKINERQITISENVIKTISMFFIIYYLFLLEYLSHQSSKFPNLQFLFIYLWSRILI